MRLIEKREAVAEVTTRMMKAKIGRFRQSESNCKKVWVSCFFGENWEPQARNRHLVRLGGVCWDHGSERPLLARDHADPPEPKATKVAMTGPA